MTDETAWVALLRGVNVGGVTIRSAALAEMFADLGFGDVRTVLASGNVTFSASESVSERATLKARIEVALRETFDYDAWIVLVTRDEAAVAISGFPYDETATHRQPWVIFCVDNSTRDELVGMSQNLDAATDPVVGGQGVVYWNPAKGHSTDTPFAKLLAKPTFRTRTTNRNLRTLRKVVG
ncbi:DUF1697 domain-containing protein [Microbacterium sp. NPDC076911]|uniref:DUF1697 domain-containing protein n=1 Tax=Microbacterium sp. NPDC076911 TaxID=3154958 RepID=UPI0034356019